MEIHRPAFVPDPSLSRESMERLQEEIADAATFTDDLGFDPASVGVAHDSDQQRLGEQTEPPLVAGVDQAFDGDDAVSAVVVSRGDEIVERVHAVEPTEIPYIPGLLSFREGGAILSALAELDSDPDVLVVDGSGRIHFREAGLATHIGVTVDCPAIGVAKNLLCGRPRQSLADPLPEGTRVAIEADGDVTAPDGTVIGYAFQSRQYDSPNQYINPLYVSPGHRVSAETAVDIVERCCGGYKLPEPTRLADSYADEVKKQL
ncbi:endonuclease V [Salinibaculum salinum]|uniref:endonuclease V n=1 Tax=Salinibaculum salinum TaxID=3131996 RepID=UPI0030EBAB34